MNIPTFECCRQLEQLKFFSSVEEEFYASFSRECAYSADEIDHFLSIPSSKFFTSFASAPPSLIEIVLPRLDEFLDNAIQKEERQTISFYFSKDDYPIGIGYDAVIAKSDLTEKELENVCIDKKLFKKRRYLYSNKRIPTWQMNVVVEFLPEPQVIIMYPGKITPPYPDLEKFGCKSYQQSVDFWSKHILIIPSD